MKEGQGQNPAARHPYSTHPTRATPLTIYHSLRPAFQIREKPPQDIVRKTRTSKLNKKLRMYYCIESFTKVK